MNNINNKWKDELYQNIDYIENILSYGPLITVNNLNGILFKCNLLNLYDELITSNDLDYDIKIIIENNILESNYNNTLIHMLEEYIFDDTLELNITIVKISKNTLTNITNHSYEFRYNKITNFYSKLIKWKNYNLEIELYNYYNINYNNILYYIDFNDLFLNKCESIELECINICYNINYNFYEEYYNEFY